MAHLFTPEEKIALYCSLFRGNDQVYSRRYTNCKTGEIGFALACGNEWVAGLCEKPRIKCSDCPHQRFLPVTQEVVRWHLSGHDRSGREFVMALYPVLLNESCSLLIWECEGSEWQKDALAFLRICQEINIPAALERFHAGAGRIWLFFEEPLPVALARKLGSSILTEALENRPEIGLEAYNRFLPSQDTLPRGGYGSRVELPLQHKARRLGDTLFLDGNVQPYEDQWEFLSQIKKIGRKAVEERVRQADAQDRTLNIPLVNDEEAGYGKRKTKGLPQGPFPERLELILDREIRIAKKDLSPGLHNRLLRLAAFQNPAFSQKQALRLATHDTPRVLACSKSDGDYLRLPRGCLGEACELMSDLKIAYAIRDERNAGTPIAVGFVGKLREEQLAAAEALLAHDTGVLSATTAFGKTVIAAWLIAKRQVNALILVHRVQLMQQWKERLSTFLNLSPGILGSGRSKLTGQVDIALIQSLVRNPQCIAEYGHLLVDECHHLPAHNFEQVAKQATAKFVTGLSATLARKDGRHPIILMQCGPVRYHVKAKEQAATRPFEHTVFVHPTEFKQGRAYGDARAQFRDLYKALAEDEKRNSLICTEVLQAVTQGRSPIVVTERNGHLETLKSLLVSHIDHLVVLKGGMRAKEFQLLSQIPENEARVLLASGKFIGEGFDDARLDTLFLTLPISWRGTLVQYVGRLHRLHKNKKEVRVYDYADLNVPMLARMFNRRCRGYEAIGYQVLLQGSAVPGWPIDVPLPLDITWKRDYAASVQRLIRDGVDLPLAQRFLYTSTVSILDAEGIQRARSATEAFLYHRLETLTQTAGRFHLNAILSIPFDGAGQMEVDFLCHEARVAVELDGPQHFADRDAYRRDRRKDALLQANGYTVLRFLTEDVGKRLDEVLDGILKALIHKI